MSGEPPLKQPRLDPMGPPGAGGEPFVLLQDQEGSRQGALTILTGHITECDKLAEIPRKTGFKVAPGREMEYDTFSILPFSCITERQAQGSTLFKAKNEGERIITMHVESADTLSVDAFCRLIPAQNVGVEGELKYNMTDEEYEGIIERIVKDEIGNGEGSSFVTPRKVSGKIRAFAGVPSVQAIFRRLLRNEFGCYWKFLFYDGRKFFVGASPERHLEVRAGEVRMNPISGTFRKRPGESQEDAVVRMMEFLQDKKEIDELFMVTDEELKMMAAMCRGGGTIIGPLLKEMSHLVHTEYLLRGKSELDMIDLLRISMYAPTVTGSPMGNACKIVAKYEKGTRSYYSSAVMMIGRHAAYGEFLDSSITIRTLEIQADGSFDIRVGATLVKDSVPSEERQECDAKARGAISAVQADRPSTRLNFDLYPAIRKQLEMRNQFSSCFWMQTQIDTEMAHAKLAGKKVVMSNNEDDFIYMLRHMLERMGCVVQVYDFFRFDEPEVKAAVAAADLNVVGPGPGDPNDLEGREDGKMAKVTRRVKSLVADKKPFLAVCLGHQVLCRTLGFSVKRKDKPTQGVQKKVDLYGTDEIVGFYNAFFVNADEALQRSSGMLRTAVDRDIGDLLATQGPGWESFQFHPESILSVNGFGIVRDALVRLVTRSGL
eukprot:TRINITY_DN32054_c0_g1_i1.p1 TRINITY_DN32054_c0_g1~~TRINITY_DN32054_c0_g1_i1.p1  ORF type:complete len:659 (+),score=255.99 TRINITY_DN32054_c0_g1_i1:87-2063(+)